MNSRDKGKRGEREAAGAMRMYLGCEARRGQQFNGIDGDDVKHSIDGVHVEVKRTEKFLLDKAMEQAVRDAGVKVPLVLHKKNRGAWLCVVPLERLMELARALAKGTEA